MKIIYVNCGVKNYMKVDHCSYRRNFCSCEKKVWKKILSFCNCKSCVYNCDDLVAYNSPPCSSHIWFSYIHNYIIILSWVYNEPIQRPALSWLLAQLVEHWTGIAGVKGSNPVQAWIFFPFLFANAKVASITTMIDFHLHFRWSNNNNNNNNNNNTYIVPISILLFSSTLMKRLWSILHPAVQTYDFHIFMTLWSSFHGFIMNQFNNLLAVGL